MKTTQNTTVFKGVFMLLFGFLVSLSLNAQVTITQMGNVIDGETAGDQSGFSISSSSDGTVLAIGAPYNAGNGAYAGHVRIYQYAAGSWTQMGSDIDGEAANDYSGWSLSLNSTGTMVAIGAPYNAGNGSNAGHVRIYHYVAGAWTQMGSDINSEAANDLSGWSVGVNSDGTVVAIGAPYNDGNGNNAGHVRIFHYAAGTWTQMGSDIDGEAAYDRSGMSVSLSSDGSVVAVGADNNDGNGTNAGQVRIYHYAAGTWTQMGSDIDGEASDDVSGGSISLSSNGTVMAVGAIGNDGNGAGAGHVRIYQYTAGSWTQMGSDIDGEAAGDCSGWSVSLNSDGTVVAIGAAGNDGNGAVAGQVRIYHYAAGTWTQMGSDIDGEAANDELGNSVSLNSAGSLVAVAAYQNDGNGSNAGHVRTYCLNRPISVQPTSKSVSIGTDVQFIVASSDPFPTLQWQANLGFGFQNLYNAGQFSGTDNDTLTVSGTTMSNNNEHFRCIINPATCPIISDEAVLTVINDIGIGAVAGGSKVAIFPNPVKDILGLIFTSSEKRIVVIYDMPGREVYRATTEEKTVSYDLGSLQKGIYILKCTTETGSVHKKFAKE